jgi:hypothetical protein
MSYTPGRDRAIATLEPLQSERRSHRRFPIHLHIEYRLLGAPRTEPHGLGQTLNISSTGVLIEGENDLRADCPLELLMDWPFLLDGVCSLRLVARGRVVRTDGRHLAVEIMRYEFRTAGSIDAKSQRRLAATA